MRYNQTSRHSLHIAPMLFIHLASPKKEKRDFNRDNPTASKHSFGLHAVDGALSCRSDHHGQTSHYLAYTDEFLDNHICWRKEMEKEVSKSKLIAQKIIDLQKSSFASRASLKFVMLVFCFFVFFWRRLKWLVLVWCAMQPGGTCIRHSDTQAYPIIWDRYLGEKKKEI